MPRRTRQWPCGQKGNGRYCLRCAQERARREREQAGKSAWHARLANAPVALEHLPQHVAERVLAIIERLECGAGYWEFKGKRLRAMGARQIVSIPVGWSYRLICREQAGRLEYLEVLTHETYNQRLASEGWP